MQLHLPLNSVVRTPVANSHSSWDPCIVTFPVSKVEGVDLFASLQLMSDAQFAGALNAVTKAYYTRSGANHPAHADDPVVLYRSMSTCPEVGQTASFTERAYTTLWRSTSRQNSPHVVLVDYVGAEEYRLLFVPLLSVREEICQILGSGDPKPPGKPQPDIALYSHIWASPTYVNAADPSDSVPFNRVTYHVSVNRSLPKSDTAPFRAGARLVQYDYLEGDDPVVYCMSGSNARAAHASLVKAMIGTQVVVLDSEALSRLSDITYMVYDEGAWRTAEAAPPNCVTALARERDSLFAPHLQVDTVGGEMYVSCLDYLIECTVLAGGKDVCPLVESVGEVWTAKQTTTYGAASLADHGILLDVDSVRRAYCHSLHCDGFLPFVVTNLPHGLRSVSVDSGSVTALSVVSCHTDDATAVSNTDRTDVAYPVLDMRTQVACPSIREALLKCDAETVVFTNSGVATPSALIAQFRDFTKLNRSFANTAFRAGQSPEMYHWDERDDYWVSRLFSAAKRYGAITRGKTGVQLPESVTVLYRRLLGSAKPVYIDTSYTNLPGASNRDKLKQSVFSQSAVEQDVTLFVAEELDGAVSADDIAYATKGVKVIDVVGFKGSSVYPFECLPLRNVIGGSDPFALVYDPVCWADSATRVNDDGFKSNLFKAFMALDHYA